MLFLIIIVLTVVLSTLCLGAMLYQWSRLPSMPLKPALYVKLIFSGIVAFIADTLGAGSFAINVALAKILRTFPDEELPAVNNGAQVVPGTIESLFFMQLFDVDTTTLITLVAGACLGGILGGTVVSRLSKQAIRLAMMVCFSVLILLLLCHQLHLLPVTGDAVELHSWQLVLGFVGVVLCGALTAVGVGLFVMVQGVLFLLNVSPVVAFPIMTTAGALQQPLTTLAFLQQKKIPLKKTLILSVGGCIGVMLTLPVFKYLTITWLHVLLLVVLTFNLIAISRAYLKSRPALHWSSKHPNPTVN